MYVCVRVYVRTGYGIHMNVNQLLHYFTLFSVAVFRCIDMKFSVSFYWGHNYNGHVVFLVSITRFYLFVNLFV